MPRSLESMLPDSPPGTTRFYRRIEEKLGASGVRSDRDLAGLVEKRLPASAVKALARGGLSESEIYQLVIPRRTLAHRVAKREALSQEESDRAVRLARVTAFAEQVFGDSGRAWRWLRQPKKQFTDRSPLEVSGTEAGARLVEELLYQIDDGLVA
ncbi:MAG TPA: antitoxin Xre/MbcA/ParS toxin-binding domain-containing protein [Bryobacteraceae bacterium]|nr:antitoxin Xre/MbcA/ParS toxin-binding domain-containing protein [Bryobacteraceae bacterium]